MARFENDRTISFIPPDGSFDLMTYRLSTQVNPLVLKFTFPFFIFQLFSTFFAPKQMVVILEALLGFRSNL